MRGREFNRAVPDDVIANRDAIHSAVVSEVDAAAHRAVQAGARPPLRYVGSGASGIVFTDRFRNRSFKVARSAFARGALAEEAEWFRAAARDPFVTQHVPHGVRFHDATGVLIKPYIAGYPGGWSDSRELGDLMDAIDSHMIARGWTRPEYKEDSFIRTPRGWILVDASSAIRVGRNLLNYVVDVALGRRPSRLPYLEKIDDLAYYIKRERLSDRNPRGTLTADDADRALTFLRARIGGGRFAWE